MPRTLVPLKRIEQRLTYGTLPDWRTFKNNFHAPDDEDRTIERYTMELRSREDTIPGITENGFYSLTDRELYTLVKKLVRKFNSTSNRADDAGSLAASILYTLGFDWV